MSKYFKVIFLCAIILAVLMSLAVYIFRGGLFGNEMSLIEKTRLSYITQKSNAAANYLSDKYDSEFYFQEETAPQKNENKTLFVNYIFSDADGKQYIVTYSLDKNNNIIIGESESH